MDENYQEAVQKAFLHYYNKGWIYQGERVINWCIRCATGISDLEVNYVSEKGKLYFIKYGPFTLATARPETKLGDTALAVHPDDERYKKYVGEELEIESVNSDIPLDKPLYPVRSLARAEGTSPKDLGSATSNGVKKIKILVVADEAVDPKFGTGIIKVTPAHDLTDSEIAQRHNLPSVKIINEHGRMNENAGIRYERLKTAEAREQIVKDLEVIGLIQKIEDYEHNVARCDRCNSVIEPLPSKQWFLKMKDLAKLALSAVESGKVKIHPARWEGPYKHWLNNVRDWNISRQLWWGHRLPVWFCTQNQINQIPNSENKFIVSIEKPKRCPICKECKMEQSQDVLDTWFSSALWPFATLGWPLIRQGYDGHASTNDYEEYYPTDFITSDRGILFLWQVRMIFSGMEFTGKPPFKDVYIHATVLTKDGKRMSKSLGTGINPMGLIDKYGTDAMRFGLAYQTTDLQDMRFNEDVVMMGKKFANKLWNISRYVLEKTLGELNCETDEIGLEKTPEDYKLITAVKSMVDTVTGDIGVYKFGEAAHVIYDTVWHDLADNYIEYSKTKNDENTRRVLSYALVASLKLLHPFMPFVTEEIWSHLPIKNKKLLLVENWPS